MAIYHFTTHVFSRGKGHSAVAAAAYRSGEVLTDERTGERHDYRQYRAKNGAAVYTALFLAEDAPEDYRERGRFWNAAEGAEKTKAGEYKASAAIAREMEAALPHELDDAAHVRIVQRFGLWSVRRFGMAQDVAIHAAPPGGDPRNRHAHFLGSTRIVGAAGFGEKTELELSGQRKKALGLPTGQQQVREMRRQWAREVNRELKAAGLEQRVTEKSFKDLGQDKAPTKHLGKAACAMERRGEKTRIGDENREAAAQNKKMEALDLQQRVMEEAVKKEAQHLAEAKAKAAAAARERAERENRAFFARNRNLAAEAVMAEKENRAAYARREMLDRGPEFWAQVDKDFAAEERGIRAAYDIADLAKDYADARRRASGLDTANGRFSGAYERAMEDARALEENLKNAKWRQEEALERLGAERESLRTAKEEREAFLMNAKLNAQFEAQRGGVEIEQPGAAMEQDNTGVSVEDSHEEEQGRAQDGGREDDYGMER